MTAFWRRWIAPLALTAAVGGLVLFGGLTPAGAAPGDQASTSVSADDSTGTGTADPDEGDAVTPDPENAAPTGQDLPGEATQDAGNPDTRAAACLKAGGSARTRAVCLAKSQMGVAEGKKGAYSCQKYFRYFGSHLNCNTNAGPWCAAFTRWIWTKAGVRGTPKSFYVPTWAGRLHRTSSPKPGDVMVLPNHHHIGLIIAVGKGGVTTIEGNHGNRVARVHRSGVQYYRMPGA